MKSNYNNPLYRSEENVRWKIISEYKDDNRFYEIVVFSNDIHYLIYKTAYHNISGYKVKIPRYRFTDIKYMQYFPTPDNIFSKVPFSWDD